MCQPTDGRDVGTTPTEDVESVTSDTQAPSDGDATTPVGISTSVKVVDLGVITVPYDLALEEALPDGVTFATMMESIIVGEVGPAEEYIPDAKHGKTEPEGRALCVAAVLTTGEQMLSESQVLAELDAAGYVVEGFAELLALPDDVFLQLEKVGGQSENYINALAPTSVWKDADDTRFILFISDPLTENGEPNALELDGQDGEDFSGGAADYVDWFVVSPKA